MKNPVRDLLLFQSRIAASVVSLKILILGFVWVLYGWQVGLFFTLVWFVAYNRLQHAYYEGWGEEIAAIHEAHHQSEAEEPRVTEIVVEARALDCPEAEPLKLLVDPGTATSEEVADLFDAMNDVYVALGGSGLKWTVLGPKGADDETASCDDS